MRRKISSAHPMDHQTRPIRPGGPGSHLGLQLGGGLGRHLRTEVMVVNPRAIKNYAGARLQRAKTDPVDAQLILDFVQRMYFVPCNRPSTRYCSYRPSSGA